MKISFAVLDRLKNYLEKDELLTIIYLESKLFLLVQINFHLKKLHRKLLNIIRLKTT